MRKSLTKKGEVYLLIEQFKEVVNKIDDADLLQRIAQDLDSIITEMQNKKSN